MAEPARVDASDDHQHHVAFYRSDEELVALVVDSFRAALERGEQVLAIVTAAHRQAIHDELSQWLDVDAAVDDERLTVLDAVATLDQFMIGGLPDPKRFENTVGDLVRRRLHHGRGLFAFGEMVAVLWEREDQAVALELEQLWNDLQTRYDFTLLCAYPTPLVTGRGPEGYVDACAVHTAVMAGPPVAPDAELVRHFPAHPGSPRLARKFVRSTLEEWGLLGLTEDMSLIVTELATNAVRHASSDFALSITRSPGGIRLTVGDTTDTAPAPRKPGRSGGGRGLHLVAATAQHWGHQPHADGKLVWAEVELPVAGDRR